KYLHKNVTEGYLKSKRCLIIYVTEKTGKNYLSNDKKEYLLEIRNRYKTANKESKKKIFR
ncbi:MAG: hypothetical protein U5K00_21485, partial [Melioribacteraceae bacterium]|nr:hypothetical protein [Melioribacteraceae bacterium]